MLPNIIFNDDHLNYDHILWDSKKLPEAPRNVNTTGITQPPMLAEAVVRVGDELAGEARVKWYESMFDCLLQYHLWLYAERDPDGSGLIVLLHPFESGLDNSPPWIHLLKSMPYPWWIHAAHSHSLEVVTNHFRRDTEHIPKSQRIGLSEALECFYAIRHLKNRSYRFDSSLPSNQLAMQDLTFNSILIRANSHLVSIAKAINKPLPDKLLESMGKSERELETMWNPEHEEYFSINFSKGHQIKQSTIATFMPLYAGSISAERAAVLVRKLYDKRLFNTLHPVPSVPVHSRRFTPDRYWQGPAWINANWLIVQGLKQYGYLEEASRLAKSTVDLVAKGNTYEYFSPLDGSPKGAKNFSWTASLTIDLIQNRIVRPGSHK
jgi:hypothetical protein